jgi:diaminohydroxyphosphoribosylaminopyrimidine deaminase/5-amino-6-(5-phosphoribosylamino)uracil reductase
MKKAKPRFSAEDEKWMALALSEAAQARGRTSPNPMVGAVLARKGKLLAKGHHRGPGLPHAEIEALKRSIDLKGATLYTTLEPCCHEGKRTPPCTKAILASGVERIVVSAIDPNPKVSGRGLKILRKAGLQVESGLFREDSEKLNVFYNHWMKTGRPYVVLKAAASLDGRIALANGKSKWITGEASRYRVHEIRAAVDAVLAGVGTIIADDPLLTARHAKGLRQPRRFILDPNFRISPKAKVLKPYQGSICTVVISPARLNSAKRHLIEKLGAKVLVCPWTKKGGFKLDQLLQELGRQEVQSVLVEGGSETWTPFIAQRQAQELCLFLAPRLLGGDAKGLLSNLKLKNLAGPTTLEFEDAEMLGPDLLLTYQFI